MQLNFTDLEKFLSLSMIELPTKCITIDINEFLFKEMIDVKEGEKFISVNDNGNVFIGEKRENGSMWEVVSEHDSFKEASKQLFKEK